jgi:hypothetical protein
MFKNIKTAELKDTTHEVKIKVDHASVKDIYKATIKAALIISALSVATAIANAHVNSKNGQNDI